MDDFLVNVQKAKRFLLEHFPFVSSTIMYIPIKKKKTKSSVIYTRDGIVINEKFDSVYVIAFLLTSSGVMYNLALNRRIKGFYKTVYYIASALYANEVCYDLYNKYGFRVNREFFIKNDLECFETLSPLLYSDIKKREDLLKLSVEDIYRILLKKLNKLKKHIETLIILAYQGKKDSEKFKKSKELLRSFIMGEFLKEDDITEALKKSEAITNIILSAVERYIHEYKGIKTHSKTFENLKQFSQSFDIKSADSSQDAIENLLNLSRFFLPTFSNILRIFSQIITEYKGLLGKYNYNRVPYKYFVYRKISKIRAIIPKYDKHPIMKIYVALDTSGSISDKEYEIFINALSFLIENLRNVEGKVWMFSGKVVAEIPFSNYDASRIFDILKKRMGYGGTVFSSVIEKLKKERDLNMSYLIVFTDGVFFDKELDVETLKKVRRIIFITTYNIPKAIENLKNVKIVKLIS